MSEPVARVFVHKTGGNVGIRWSGVPVDGAPLMHDGELLYTADAIHEEVLAEREAIAKQFENSHPHDWPFFAQAIRARGAA